MERGLVVVELLEKNAIAGKQKVALGAFDGNQIVVDLVDGAQHFERGVAESVVIAFVRRDREKDDREKDDREAPGNGGTDQLRIKIIFSREPAFHATKPVDTTSHGKGTHPSGTEASGVPFRL